MLSSSIVVAQRSLLCGRRVALVTLKRQQQQQQQYAPHTPRRFTANTTTNTATATATATKEAFKGSKAGGSKQTSIWQKIKERPIEYATVPCVAAFVGIMTNWMGVKMLFYPIEYIGTTTEWYPRDDLSPFGYFGWQGVVPTKTKVMAERLVKIITERLLSLQEAFGRLQPDELSALLLPAVAETVRQDCGEVWYQILKPVLPVLLAALLSRLQVNIDDVLDLKSLVRDAFLRDKIVLVDLFQKVGRVELEFLVNSGFGFGFLLGLAQMGAWAYRPVAWTLPVAGALVGYVTNWIAIKLLFEPADPVDVLGLFQVQGLFESRQIEVSNEFGHFLEKRVLNAESLLKELARGEDEGELYAFLRRQLPYPIPGHILTAAVKAINKVANNPLDYPEVHKYVDDKLDIQETLSSRLKLLSSTDFEDLLHPVFQEDEITLIATGGVLGAIAGLGQTQLGWGGPFATRNAIATIISVLTASAGFYFYQKYEELADEKEQKDADDLPVSVSSVSAPASSSRPAAAAALRRRQTVVVRIPPTPPLE